MRREVAIVGLAIFAVAAGLALVNAVPSIRKLTVVSAVSGTPQPTPQFIPVQPGWETLPGIPMYPGAYWLHDLLEPSETDRYLPGTIRYVGYLTSDPDSEEMLQVWYRDYLLRHGWTIDGLEYIHNYIWVDKAGPVPWGLSLRVETSRRHRGGLDVHLDMHRWPNVNKIPLYPDAQQVEVKFVPPPKGDEGEMQVRVTTYATEAGPEEVGRYYKSVLAEHLWRADEKVQRQINQAPGVVYHHWYGTMGGPEGANLYILAQPQPDGLTKVEMRVEVFNFGYSHPGDDHDLRVPLEK